MPSAPRRRASRPTAIVRFSSRVALERLARTRRIPLRTTADDDGTLLCPLCMAPFCTTGDDARLLLPTTGYVLHEMCAVTCCRAQRSRELETRSQRRWGDEGPAPNTGYICEFARTPLTPGEIAALVLPPWPSADQGWLDSEAGYTQTFALVVPTGVAPGASFRASLSNVLTDVRAPDGAQPGSTIYADVRFRGPSVRWQTVDVPADVRPGDTFAVVVDDVEITVTAAREATTSATMTIPVPVAHAQPSECDVVRVYTRTE